MTGWQIDAILILMMSHGHHILMQPLYPSTSQSLFQSVGMGMNLGSNDMTLANFVATYATGNIPTQGIVASGMQISALATFWGMTDPITFQLNVGG